MTVLLLRQIPLFASLTDAELAALMSYLRKVSYPPETILFHEGAAGNTFYIILEGAIEILKALGDDHQYIMVTRGPGEFVGEMSLLNRDGVRTASARVTHETLVFEMTRADFGMLLSRHPSLAYEMLHVLSIRMRDYQESVIQELREKNQQLESAYVDLQVAQAQLIEQERIQHELKLANQIQLSMLPLEIPQIPGFDIGACMVPARQVGGDFYDIVVLGPHHLAIAIGDVSGKGVPAAIFMALISSLLRAEMVRKTDLQEAVVLLNQHLMARNPTFMFATLLYGVLRLDSGEFEYVRAGHEIPLGWHQDGQRIMVAQGRGTPVGLFPDLALDVQRVILPPGSTLLLFTDGAVDAIDSQGQPFGYDRLIESVHAHSGNSAQNICDRLVQTISAYNGAKQLFDDITFVALCAR